ncbi:carbamoyltransferase C-terminal domain-containing protein [Cohnella soli]|uniref:Carbamoyltransferase C-terminal domain-containing protein n=1 Tax=Cohnella soli TaxID=425005 RepID=A0ABW0I434_9BACL
MKDGYYLSIYAHVDELTHLLEAHTRHDQNMALFRKEGENVTLVRFWELERFSRIKAHPYSFFDETEAKAEINRRLQSENLSLEDMVEVWGTPRLQNHSEYHSMQDYPALSYHSVSHLFSTLLMDTDVFYKERMIGMAVDAGPDGVLDPHEIDKSPYAGCYSDCGKIELFPIASPALLWYELKARFRMREGSLMALGTSSTSTACFPEMQIPHIDDYLSRVYAGEYIDALLSFVNRLTESDTGTLFNGFDPRFTEEENRISMVVKQIDHVSFQMMCANIDNLIEKFNIVPSDTYLALSGGFALNCPINARLMQAYSFKGFQAPPCVNDSGLSLGMGLYAFYARLSPQKIRFRLNNAFYGEHDRNLSDILQKYSVYISQVSSALPDVIAKDILAHPIVWFDGAAEMGPRALGKRSILGDPGNAQTKDKLNEIKQREWWRPVAPIVILEELNNWFDRAFESPFMLHAFEVREEKRGLVPGILHLDGTARVQTITKRSDPVLYDVIAAIQKQTGIPMLCNTSLNDKGEPIIQTLDQAVHFALQKDMPVIYLNRTRVVLRGHAKYRGTMHSAAAKLGLSVEEKERLMAIHNPYNIPEEMLLYYFESLHRLNKSTFNYDIRDEHQAKALKRTVSLHRRMFERELLDVHLL